MGRLTDFINKKAPTPTVAREMTRGAYGGIVPRTFPTLVNPINTAIPHRRPIGGIAQPIADRPNSAPMLKQAGYHTQIPGIGILRGLPTVSFRRGTDVGHPAAVTDVTHIRGNAGVHPTVVRQVRRGNGAL